MGELASRRVTIVLFLTDGHGRSKTNRGKLIGGGDGEDRREKRRISRSWSSSEPGGIPEKRVGEKRTLPESEVKERVQRSLLPRERSATFQPKRERERASDRIL